MNQFFKPLSMQSYGLFFALLISLLGSGCKGQTLSGVYAGVKLSLEVNFGGGMGMGRDDITLLLRPDGTFNDDLSDSTWKTANKGTYKKVGNNVMLTYEKENRTDTFTYEKGVLSSGSTNFVKMDNSDKVPAGDYSFTYASGSGGGMSGSPYIGVTGGKSFYFDGKGHFSKDGYGAVSISGDNIGGGSTRSDSTKTGTYKLHDGELTLTYQDKKVEKHSFFASDGETVTAVIDGQLFFMDKTKIDKVLPTTKKLVEEIKKKQGGNAIDDMQSILMAYSTNDFNVVHMRNFENNSDRIQFYKDGKLLQVVQRNGQDSWRWIKGKKGPLTPEVERDMKYNFYTGVSALKANTVGALLKGTVSRAEQGLSLNYSVDGIDFKIIVDKDYKIIGEYNNISGKAFETSYRDFRETNGILFPYFEEDKTEDYSNETAFTKISVNHPDNLNWPSPEEIK